MFKISWYFVAFYDIFLWYCSEAFNQPKLVVFIGIGLFGVDTDSKEIYPFGYLFRYKNRLEIAKTVVTIMGLLYIIFEFVVCFIYIHFEVKDYEISVYSFCLYINLKYSDEFKYTLLNDIKQKLVHAVIMSIQQL